MQSVQPGPPRPGWAADPLGQPQRSQPARVLPAGDSGEQPSVPRLPADVSQPGTAGQAYGSGARNRTEH